MNTQEKINSIMNENNLIPFIQIISDGTIPVFWQSTNIEYDYNPPFQIPIRVPILLKMADTTDIRYWVLVPSPQIVESKVNLENFDE